jgi:hypothetical protein
MIVDKKCWFFYHVTRQRHQGVLYKDPAVQAIMSKKININV